MSKPTILLIDYDPGRIEATSRPLTTLGYRVEIATDGLAGIAAVERLKPDLILVEMMVLKEQGIEVCRELRKAEPDRSLSIIILSDSASEECRSEAALADANGYLIRPLSEERLAKVCNGSLAEEPASILPVEPLQETEWRLDALSSDFGFPDFRDQDILQRIDDLIPSGLSIAATKTAPRPPAKPTSIERPPVPIAVAAPAAAERATVPRAMERRTAPSVERVFEATASRAMPAPGLHETRRPASSERLPSEEAAISPRTAPTSGKRSPTRDLLPVVSMHAPRSTPEPAVDRPQRTWRLARVSLVGLAVAAGLWVFVSRKSPLAGVAQSRPPNVSQSRGPHAKPFDPPPVRVPSVEPEIHPPARPPVVDPSHLATPASSAPVHERRPQSAPLRAVEAPRAELPQPTPQDRLALAPPVPVPAAEPPALEAPPVVLNASESQPSREPPPVPPANSAPIELSEADIPPMLRTSTTPRYPAEILPPREEFTLEMSLLVDEAGRVTAVSCDTPSPEAFAEAATTVARQRSYRPAMKNGVPVRVWVKERFVFKP